MSRSYAFRQVDVFTDRIFGGNPLAVFTDGRGLSDQEMQAIALEMNLSETTFILPPDDPDYAAKVRIFTPTAELPFAGHPTLGTAWVLARMGVIPPDATEATLELGIGPMKVTFEGTAGNPELIWMHQREAEFGEIIEDPKAVARALNVAPDDLLADMPVQFVSTGLPFLYVALRSAEVVDRARLTSTELAGSVGASGVFMFASEPGSNRAYSRMIATIGGTIWEDPATGSASGPLGAYMVRHGLAGPGDVVDIVSEQGTQMGRQSFVRIRVTTRHGQPGPIDVGGGVVPALEGTLVIP